MSDDDDKRPCCPHCGSALKPFRMPYDGGWSGEVHLACFDDDCPYYQRGWAWMMEKYEAKASYRYRLDPKSGVASPLPVWSPTAIRDRIIDDKA